MTGGEKSRLLIFVVTFAKPKTDAREDKKSLSKSISNGLKRYNERTRRVVVRVGCCCMLRMSREKKSQAEK